MSKILLLNGSPHRNGCIATAFDEMTPIFSAEGIETETVHIGNQPIRGCVGCNRCQTLGRCTFDDQVNAFAPKFEAADGLIIGSPVYYGSPNGTLLAFLDRLFFSTAFSKQMKVGAAIVNCRRGGNTATFDVLNKYFMISGMAVATSTYWNQIHGFTPEDVRKDAEGLQTMRNLARNAAFLVKAIGAAKAQCGLPKVETEAFTCFQDGK